MDPGGNVWYFSIMETASEIPVFTLFGETDAFPDVVHVERISDRARAHDWIITAHRHTHLVQIFRINDGAATAQVDGEILQLGNGDFLYVPEQVVHGFVFSAGTEGHVFSFPLPVLRSLSTRGGVLAATLTDPVLDRFDARMEAMARLLCDTLKGSGIFRAASAIALAQALLIEIGTCGARETTPAAAPERARLAEFDRLIARHQSDGWGAGEYARALALSPGHLNRLCRAAHGRSASAHIEALRTAEACRLLAFTRLPVAEIGFRLGFQDPSYFSRRFRIAQGVSPSAYRLRFSG